MAKEILEKIYHPAQVEEKWIAFWEKEHLFRASPRSEAPPFSMVIPPPNVTGSLHVGHALNNTLQDILARWKRMCGYNALWVPGTDHAGIATQNVVERRLAKEKKERHSLGRALFIQEVWRWKEESGGAIVRQLRRLGASCDWERERFTMDEGLSRAVREVFVRLYREGLIYRAERLINWCPRCRTALSDIEVEHEEAAGKMYWIKYPMADEADAFLTVATTRPETMLGDTAVAVHPEDPWFNRFIGRKARLPLTSREIPVVGDPVLVDREFGTGGVKITPAHDFNDEQAGKRHGLPSVSLLNADGISLPGLEKAKVEAGLEKEIAGKTLAEARPQVVRRLEELGLLVKVEDHRHALGKCYRCKTVVEPFQSLQWFVRINDPENSLAGPAIEAVRGKKIRLIPESWEPNYFGWMENIQDWCISRQIWWGHQIPAWYCTAESRPECENPIVAFSPPERCPHCGSAPLRQDPDVLDTWFSSALWPFSTLGWPAPLQPDGRSRQEAEALLRTFYPTSTLVTSFDILFFWVARMIMMGIHFMGEIPFRDVYIHALVRDAEGQKMSKSKGNVIDPLEIMDQYGTDALRFTLASMASPGRDIKLSEERIEGCRNFANKLWNAARFSLMNLEENAKEGASDPLSFSIADRWIQGRLREVVRSVDGALKNYRFDEAAAALYQFIWHEFCDWYLELIKVDLQEGDEAQKRATRKTLRETFETILRLLHPFMPFITEELHPYFSEEGGSLAVASYPQPGPDRRSGDRPPSAEEGIETLIETVNAIRNLRGEMNIPPSEELSLFVSLNVEQSEERYKGYLPYIKKLARISNITLGAGLERPKRATTVPTKEATIYLPLNENRLQKEKERLEKVLSKLEKEEEALQKRLADDHFRAKAPEAYRRVDDQMTEKHGLHKKVKKNYEQILEMLSESK